MREENAEIRNYLSVIGYVYIPADDDIDDIFGPESYEKGNIRIEYDSLFCDGLRIYKGGEMVFDIDAEVRNVMRSPYPSKGVMKTQGIKHVVQLTEIKEALRDLNITDLLDG